MKTSLENKQLERQRKKKIQRRPQIRHLIKSLVASLTCYCFQMPRKCQYHEQCLAFTGEKSVQAYWIT